MSRSTDFRRSSTRHSLRSDRAAVRAVPVLKLAPMKQTHQTRRSTMSLEAQPLICHCTCALDRHCRCRARAKPDPDQHRRSPRRARGGAPTPIRMSTPISIDEMAPSPARTRLGAQAGRSLPAESGAWVDRVLANDDDEGRAGPGVPGPIRPRSKTSRWRSVRPASGMTGGSKLTATGAPGSRCTDLSTPAAASSSCSRPSPAWWDRYKLPRARPGFSPRT